jgi:hypothetical protein
MNKKLIASPLMVIILLTVTSISAQVNWFQDPGFEEQTATTLDGTIWFVEGGDPFVELGSGQARSGDNCVLITSIANGWSGIAQIVPMWPETEYTMSAWVRGDDITGWGGDTGWFGVTGNADVDHEINYNVTSDWTELSITFTTGPNSGGGTEAIETLVWFGVWNETAGPQYWVDDFSLTSPSALATDDSDIVPNLYSLSQNYPNPFNPTTTFDFTLEAAGPVNMAVYDLAGHKVRTLVDVSMSPGTHSVTWDGRDDAGIQMSAGVYFYRLTAGTITLTKKMMLMK